jgi:hypothetical protein
MASTLKRLQNRQAALVAAMKELSKTAAEEERSFTDEEQADFNKHETELEKTQTALARELKLQQFERDLIPVRPCGSMMPISRRPMATRGTVMLR